MCIKTRKHLKKELDNLRVALHEANLDSAELGEMVNEKDAEIAELKARLSRFDRVRGEDDRFTGKKLKNKRCWQ